MESPRKKSISLTLFLISCQVFLFALFGFLFASFSLFQGQNQQQRQENLSELLWEASAVNKIRENISSITKNIVIGASEYEVGAKRIAALDNVLTNLNESKIIFESLNFHQSRVKRPLILSRQAQASTLILNRTIGYLEELQQTLSTPEEIARNLLFSPIFIEITQINNDLASSSLQLEKEAFKLSEEIQTSINAAQIVRIILSIMAVILVSFATSLIIRLSLESLRKIIASVDDMTNAEVHDDIYAIREKVDSLQTYDSVFSEVFDLKQIIIRFYNKLAEMHEYQKHLSLTDSITQLGNNRSCENELKKLIRLSARENKSITIIYIDIDNYHIYKSCGVSAVEETLASVAGIISRLARRPLDQPFRLDGGEFILIFYSLGPDQISSIKEKILIDLSKINESCLRLDNSTSKFLQNLQLRVGVSCYDPSCTPMQESDSPKKTITLLIDNAKNDAVRIESINRFN